MVPSTAPVIHPARMHRNSPWQGTARRAAEATPDTDGVPREPVFLH